MSKAISFATELFIFAGPRISNVYHRLGDRQNLIVSLRQLSHPIPSPFKGEMRNLVSMFDWIRLRVTFVSKWSKIFGIQSKLGKRRRWSSQICYSSANAPLRYVRRFQCLSLLKMDRENLINHQYLNPALPYCVAVGHAGAWVLESRTLPIIVKINFRSNLCLWTAPKFATF